MNIESALQEIVLMKDRLAAMERELGQSDAAFDLTPYITHEMKVIEGGDEDDFDILVYCDRNRQEAYALTWDGGIAHQGPKYKGFCIQYEAECQEGMSRDEVRAMLIILGRYPNESDWHLVAPRLTKVTGVFYPHD